MSHLGYSEIISSVDSFFTSLLGLDNYQRWKNLKLQLNMESEKVFVTWMLDIVEQRSSADVRGGGAGGVSGAGVDDDGGGGGGALYGGCGSMMLGQGTPPIPVDNKVEQEVMVALESGLGEEGETCQLCSQYFPNMQALQIHYRHVHLLQQTEQQAEQQALALVYQCGDCGKMFNTKQALVSHCHLVHDPGKKTYACQQCDETFRDRTAKARHDQDAHGEKVKLHACEFCDKVFGERCTMLKHQRWVHLNIKKHDCQYCGRKFSQASDLKRHETNVHLGIKAYCCPECGKNFSTKSSMLGHHQRIHKLNDDGEGTG